MTPSQLLSILILPLLSACVATGDWDADSITFNPQMADQRLMAMRAQIDAIHSDTAAQRRRTDILEGEVKRAVASRNATQAQVDGMKNQITQLENLLTNDRRRLATMHTQNQALSNELCALESSIETQELRLAKLRAELALILTNL